MSRNAKPDIAYWDADKREMLIPIVIKTRFSFSFSSDKAEDLIFNIHQSLNLNKEIANSIIKIYTYMVRFKTTYGVLSNCEQTWFLQRKKNQLYITDCIHKDRLLEKLFILTKLAETNEEKSQDTDSILQLTKELTKEKLKLKRK